jgi:hypothetical protein
VTSPEATWVSRRAIEGASCSRLASLLSSRGRIPQGGGAEPKIEAG